MRKAGEQTVSDPEIFQTIWKHLKSDGMPDQAANQLTAEMVTHGEDVDSSVEKYERAYDNFRERGYNEHAAQAMAVESLEGGEEPRESKRFAGIQGKPFNVPDDASGEDIAEISRLMTGTKPEKVYMNGAQIL